MLGVLLSSYTFTTKLHTHENNVYCMTQYILRVGENHGRGRVQGRGGERAWQGREDLHALRLR